ncbi:hypothetical protein MAHJHV28_47380 [Mycobacterium avium subsp. hominissuis]
MLFGVIRPARLAAVTAALVVACGGPVGSAAAATTTRSLVTPTTQIAGAGVLGNDRRPRRSGWWE